jgi:hypothetical protein
MTTRRRSLGLGIALGVAVALAWSAAGEAAARADPPARIAITVVEARKGPPFLHPTLKPLWEVLKKTFGDKFTSYDLVQAAEKVLASGGREEVPLPTGETFVAVYDGVGTERGLVKVAIEMGPFRTSVRIHDGGTFFQAGRTWKDGTLVIAVKASLVRE